MRIAICDDSPQDIAAISRCINRITEYVFEYDIFHEPAELIKSSVEQQIHYDLYIFDIEMPQMNGIDLAGEIRKTDAKALFVFLTSHSAWMKYVFSVTTLDFIEKPITDDRLKELILRAMVQLEMTNQNFSFSYRKNRQSLRSDDILYIEKRGRQAIIRTNQMTYKTNMTLEELWEQLDERVFIHIHTSYIFNLGHLVSSSGGDAKLDNDEILHVTKGYRKRLAEKYIEFVKGGMW